MSSKYSTMIIYRELFIWDIIDNLKQNINSILRKLLDLFQWGFKVFLILSCPHRDREKQETTIISLGTTNGFSNSYSPLVNEPHCGINVVYQHLKKGIKRLVAPNGQQPTWTESQPHPYVLLMGVWAWRDKQKLLSTKEVWNLFKNEPHRFLSRSGLEMQPAHDQKCYATSSKYPQPVTAVAFAATWLCDARSHWCHRRPRQQMIIWRNFYLPSSSTDSVGIRKIH